MLTFGALYTVMKDILPHMGYIGKRTKEFKGNNGCTRLNTLFFETVAEPGQTDAKPLMDEGMIKGHNSGPTIANAVLDCLMREELSLEYQHVNTLIESSKYMQMHEDIFRGERGRKDLEERIKEVREHYGIDVCQERLDEVKQRLCGAVIQLLCKSGQGEYAELAELLKEAGDAALSICVCLAVSACDMECREDAKGSEGGIEDKKEQLREITKEFVDKQNRKKNASWLLTCPKLTEKFWETHRYTRTNKFNENIELKNCICFHDVYQLPEMEADNGEKWNLSRLTGKTVFVEAPNGYGKTSLLKGILLCSLYSSFITESSEKEKYQELLRFHGMGSDVFCLYLEVKNTDFDMQKSVLDNLFENLEINGVCAKDEFEAILIKYSQRGNAILLIDGYEEASAKQQQMLRKWLIDLRNDRAFGNRMTVVLATRPLYITESMNEYNKWKIRALDTKKNAEVIRTFAENYLEYIDPDIKSERGELTSADYISREIISNYYLSRIAVTPAILVRTIINCIDNSMLSVHRIVDGVIEDLMVRYDRNTHDGGYVKVFRMIHEELAYRMLCDDELTFGYKYGREFEDSVSSAIAESRKKSARTDPEYWPEGQEEIQSIYTKVGLLERKGTRIRFMVPYVLKRDLAAKKIIRDLGENDVDYLLSMVKRLLPRYRYEVLVMILVILYNKGAYGYLGITYGPVDIEELLEPCMEYLQKCAKEVYEMEEAEYIKQAIILLLSNAYGVIPMTNVNNVSGHTKYAEIRSRLLNIIQDVKGKEWKAMAEKLLIR